MHIIPLYDSSACEFTVRY